MRASSGPKLYRQIASSPLEVKANGYDWMVHTTKYVEVGSHVGIKVIPFNIQVMHKPESSDEKAVEIDV